MLLKAILLLLLGSVAGTSSGLVGIGGGTLLTPALIYLFGFEQHIAQGTTLALLVPPIGLMGALTYYRQGYVDLKVVILICIGFFVGSLLGAKLAVGLPDVLLKRMFGTMTLIISLKMILSK
ncbi:sulfite exporter TauE/SafE family protein [Nostoc sp.]|uniref:sulfite exporter TauE/SafE family protein n=1 Tax=Nostoc sp. TaxID=1180 RepID=UPI002FF64DD9